MTATTAPRPRTHALIAGAALVWNLIGLAMFVAQVRMTPADLAALPPPDRSVFEATPVWLLAVFGVAVVTGVAGSAGLLLGQRWAAPVLGVSLLAVVVQVAASLAVTPAWAAYGAGGLVLPVLLIAIAAALYRYAQRR